MVRKHEVIPPYLSMLRVFPSRQTLKQYHVKINEMFNVRRCLNGAIPIKDFSVLFFFCYEEYENV